MQTTPAPPLTPGEELTVQQQRHAKMALAVTDRDLKTRTREAGLSYSTSTKILQRIRPLKAEYLELFQDLLAEEFPDRYEADDPE